MSGIHYRRNIDCLRDDELHDLREAFAALYALPPGDPYSFARQASFHGGPPITYCMHGAPGFFTWHRAEAKSFEDALRYVGCDVSLPFWDWSTGPSTGVPEACREPTYVNRSGATVANPLFRGPRPAGGQTNRRPDIDLTSFDDLAAGAQTAMTATTFSSFQNQINGVHGGVHVRVGGDMGGVPTAAYDPIFYLHHANIDRLWARWQTTHPGSLPPNEAAWELPPFNRPYSTQWMRGSDVESTDALGYRYRSFCFFIPPFRLWEVIEFPLPPLLRERMTSARLIVRTQRMQPRSVEVRAFLNQPKAKSRTKTTGNPSFAGVFGFLGHEGDLSDEAVDAAHCPECTRLGHDHDHAAHTAVAGGGAEHDHAGHDHAGHDHAGHDHADHDHAAVEERFDVELDLTEAIRNLDDDVDETSLKLVAVDENGDDVGPDEVLIDEIELVVD